MNRLPRHRPPLIPIMVMAAAMAAPLAWAVVLGAPVVREMGGAGALVANEVFFWDLGLGVLWVVHTLEGGSPASMGWRRLFWADGLLGLLAGLGMCLLVLLLTGFEVRVLGWSTRTLSDVAAVASWPFWLRIVTSLRAGVVEEILYRAYPVMQLEKLTGRRWPGAVVGLGCFTISHLPYSGTGHSLGVVLPLGAVLTALYLWRRHLPLNIGVHFLSDMLVSSGLPLLPLFAV